MITRLESILATIFTVFVVGGLFMLHGHIGTGVHITKKAPQSVANPAVIPTPASIAGIDTLVNNQRATAGLAPLAEDGAIDATAALKCNDMAVNHYFSHDHNGVSWTSTFDGVMYAQAGENLAEGFYDAQSTVSAWIASPDHLANIMNPAFTEVGYAVCQDSTGYPYVVQHLLMP